MEHDIFNTLLSNRQVSYKEHTKLLLEYIDPVLKLLEKKLKTETGLKQYARFSVEWDDVEMVENNRFISIIAKIKPEIGQNISINGKSPILITNENANNYTTIISVSFESSIVKLGSNSKQLRAAIDQLPLVDPEQLQAIRDYENSQGQEMEHVPNPSAKSLNPEYLKALVSNVGFSPRLIDSEQIKQVLVEEIHQALKKTIH